MQAVPENSLDALLPRAAESLHPKAPQPRCRRRNFDVGRSKSGFRRVTLALCVLVWLTIPLPHSSAAAPEGVALAIVYDTSGSMLQKVRDSDGRLTPKHVIAARALNSVLDRLQAVASGPENSRPMIEAGLVSFQGEHAAMPLKLEPFDSNRFRNWLKGHSTPQRGTPLGEAVRLAGQAVLKSELPRKHVLVITDGINTQGPDPVETIPGLQKAAAHKQSPLSFHFVAFDVNAEVFSGVKKLGGTVLGANDEKQLQSQLEFILSKKILLEDEEPPAAKPKPN